MPAKELHGRVALVTGSTDGIGLATARALAAQGCAVMLNGFGEPAAIEALCTDISAAQGVDVAHAAADLRDSDEAAGLVAQVLARFGRLDVLGNNAGTQHKGPIEDHPAPRWREVMALNLDAAFHTIRTALPAMRTNGWGRIVNIASAHGLTASPFKSAYIAAKHGVVGLSKTVALETAGQGITCNAICPGYVLTPLVEAQIPDQMKVHGMDRDTVIREVMLLRQPSRQFATVEQIGGTTVYLCSSAADQVTGTTISVDGGWTAL